MESTRTEVHYVKDAGCPNPIIEDAKEPHSSSDAKQAPRQIREILLKIYKETLTHETQKLDQAQANEVQVLRDAAKTDADTIVAHYRGIDKDLHAFLGYLPQKDSNAATLISGTVSPRIWNLRDARAEEIASNLEIRLAELRARYADLRSKLYHDLLNELKGFKGVVGELSDNDFPRY